MIADKIYSGGGVKGIAFAGSELATEEAGYTETGDVAGTSAGAIAATAVALDYTAAQLKALFDFDFSKLDDRLPLGIPNYFGHGVTRGKALSKWLQGMISGAPGAARSTFGDLPEGKLQVVGTDITFQRMVVFPGDVGLYRDPKTGSAWRPEDFPLWLAARISAGYPGFFPPMVLTDHATGKDAWLVDGGVTSGFPIFLFDKPHPTRPTWGYQLYDGPADNHVGGAFWPIPFLEAIINTAINTLDTFEARTFASRIVNIDTHAVSALDFNLTDEQKTQLYESGRTSTASFFAGHPDARNRFGVAAGSSLPITVSYS